MPTELGNLLYIAQNAEQDSQCCLPQRRRSDRLRKLGRSCYENRFGIQLVSDDKLLSAVAADDLRTWQEHMQTICIYCKVHSKQSVIHSFQNHPACSTLSDVRPSCTLVITELSAKKCGLPEPGLHGRTEGIDLVNLAASLEHRQHH